VARAGRILGLRREGSVRLPSDAGGRLDIDALRRAVRADRSAGSRPFCVVANAGTNTTGAVDDLFALRSFCDAEGLWLHVDGAYGAPAALTERGRAILAGLGAADSITLDPHKWLFQPLEIGSLLVRDPRALEEALRLDDSHLHYDPQGASALEGQEPGWYVQFRDRDLQHSRSFKALKLWMAMKVFGADAFARAIDHGMDLAELAQAELLRRKGWRVLTPARLAVVTFRFEPSSMDAPAADLLQQDLAKELEQGGFAALSTIQAKGRTALRICTAHPHATEGDVRALVEWLSERAERRAR
jgi:glutamate/tyrosine decarboxylase-like PLP-dependent enzyme